VNKEAPLATAKVQGHQISNDNDEAVVRIATTIVSKSHVAGAKTLASVWENQHPSESEQHQYTGLHGQVRHSANFNRHSIHDQHSYNGPAGHLPKYQFDKDDKDGSHHPAHEGKKKNEDPPSSNQSAPKSSNSSGEGMATAMPTPGHSAGPVTAPEGGPATVPKAGPKDQNNPTKPTNPVAGPAVLAPLRLSVPCEEFDLDIAGVLTEKQISIVRDAFAHSQRGGWPAGCNPPEGWSSWQPSGHYWQRNLDMKPLPAATKDDIIEVKISREGPDDVPGIYTKIRCSDLRLSIISDLRDPTEEVMYYDTDVEELVTISSDSELVRALAQARENGDKGIQLILCTPPAVGTVSLGKKNKAKRWDPTPRDVHGHPMPSFCEDDKKDLSKDPCADIDDDCTKIEFTHHVEQYKDHPEPDWYHDVSVRAVKIVKEPQFPEGHPEMISGDPDLQHILRDKTVMHTSLLEAMDEMELSDAAKKRAQQASHREDDRELSKGHEKEIYDEFHHHHEESGIEPFQFLDAYLRSVTKRVEHDAMWEQCLRDQNGDRLRGETMYRKKSGTAHQYPPFMKNAFERYQ